MASLQDFKDFFKALEIIAIIVLLLLGHQYGKISGDFVVYFIIVYMVINIFRIATEPSWTTKERIKTEITKLKIYLIDKNK